MKKIKAFIVAFVLFILSIVGIHYFIADDLDFNSRAYHYWTGSQKFTYMQGIKENLGQDSMLVFGSSEFQHGTASKYFLKQVLEGQSLDTMLIGAGYYQSLSHAIMLGALEPEMENRRAVLLISPAWFKKGGVDPQAFGSRFSEEAYLSCIENPKLSPATKAYLMKRTEELLAKDTNTLKRIRYYNQIAEGKSLPPLLHWYLKFNKEFLKERGRFSAVLTTILLETKEYDKSKGGSVKPIDWEAYHKEAQQDGERLTSGNDYNMIDKIYQQKVAPKEKVKKNSALKSSYCSSPEYEDLRCFLELCEELDLELLLISPPVNGIWYDYTGFPRADREQYYQNIRVMAQDYQISLDDLSEHEYTKYFFEDSVHFALKGWLYLDESIYNFARKSKR